jgi:hypothetical protein
MLKKAPNFVLVGRLPATYMQQYASVAVLPAAALDGLFEHPISFLRFTLHASRLTWVNNGHSG